MQYKGKTLCSIAPPIDYIPVNVRSVSNGNIVERKMAIPLDEDSVETYTTIGNDYFFHKHKNNDYDNPSYLLLDEEEKENTQLPEKLPDEYWADGRRHDVKKQQPIKRATVNSNFSITTNNIGRNVYAPHDIQIDNHDIVVSAKFENKEIRPGVESPAIWCQAGSMPGKTIIHIKFRKSQMAGVKYAEEIVDVPVVVEKG